MADKTTSYERRVKRLRENYLKKVAERESKGKKMEPKGPVVITEMNAEPAIDLIGKTENKEQLAAWHEQESQDSRPRKTVIEALEDKMPELKENKGSEGEE